MAETISIEAARNLVLATMGLAKAPARRATKKTLLTVIERMGALQIDTIHVVARSPYLVLWTRVGDYEPVWLEELLSEGAIFEYWSHEACFLPIGDYPLYRRLMLDGKKGWKSSPGWIAGHPDEVERVLAYIRETGPVRSADFERKDGRKGSWWDWKPEKLALEHLHSAGDLMIAARRNFQRIYDLRERVLPYWQDEMVPDLETVQKELASKAVRALGLATPRWMADYFRTPKGDALRQLAKMAEIGELCEFRLEGMKEPCYVHPDNYKLLAKARSLKPSYTCLLSPFDPLVWDRNRTEQLFGFEYRLECYTSGPKRRYGYFSLPILHRGALIGRLDPKAHRSEGVFEVKALHLEPGVRFDGTLVQELATAIHRLACWHQTPKIMVSRSDPPRAAVRLREALKQQEKGNSGIQL